MESSTIPHKHWLSLLTSKEKLLLLLDEEDNGACDLNLDKQELIPQYKEDLVVLFIELPLILLVEIVVII